MEYIEMPKIKRRIIYSFSNQEIKYIMDYYDKNTFIGYRNYTIMSLLLGTGIRKSELLQLKLLDLDFDADFINRSVYSIGPLRPLLIKSLSNKDSFHS